MSATILPFDRVRVLHRGLHVDEARRRVRMGARAAGCSEAQVHQADRYAVRLWIDNALDAHFVIERAIDHARHLARASNSTAPDCA